MDFEIFPIKTLSKSESYKCNTIHSKCQIKNHISCAYVKKQSKNYKLKNLIAKLKELTGNLPKQTK